jgi:ABC-2 type transport system permease protein
MLTEFINTLRRLRGAIIGWSLGVGLYGALISSFYSSMAEIGDEMLGMLENYPPELMAFFPNMSEFTSPIGYISTYFSDLMTVIIAFFAITTCSKMLVGDEESGILDLVISYPVSRTKLFWGRLLAFLTATITILLASWLGWLIPAESSGFPLTAFELLLTMLPILAIMLLFGSLALLFSLWLPSARMANALTSTILVGNFLLVGMSSLNEDLLPIYEKTPLYFNQGAKIIESVEWSWLGGLSGVALLLFLVSWGLFFRRDIRVGGEAGWQLSIPKMTNKTS